MTYEEIRGLDEQYVLQTYGRFPVAIDHGSGATLYDPAGKAYIDFASGIGVNSVGYANPKWVAAVTEQAGKLAHVSNLYYTEPYARLAKELCTRAGMAAAFFANSGAESNEGVIKLARKYSFDKYGEGRGTIITLRNSFHGRTVTTLAATGQDVFHNYFFPFTEGFRYAEAQTLDAVQDVSGHDVCAVLVELVQGEGGVNPLDKAFVLELEQLCAKRDWLLLVDEVQTGVGRTGSLFCFQQYGIHPAAVSFAKGIAGGLPMGGFMVSEDYRGVLNAGTHATTFGANPICASAALAVLDILDDDALAAVTEKGNYLRAAIEGMNSPYVKAVKGLGLMLGVALTEELPHKKAVGKLLEKGLLCLTAGSDTLRMLPPLTITTAELDAGIAILRQVLTEQ